MNALQADRLIKAIVDGGADYAQLAKAAELDPVELVRYAEVVDRAIGLMDGFYKYGHENMAPAGMPPPKNPYFNLDQSMESQPPEYYAYEAVSRGGVDRARCIWICEQFGLDAATAEDAIDHVCMPWRPRNGWKTYVRAEPNGRYILQNKPPVKLKRHLERLRDALVLRK
jgi:hypothetical protein